MIAQGKTRSVAALGLAHETISSPERAKEAGHRNSNSLEFEGFNYGKFAIIGSCQRSK
jgi:hypothetical protein